eukprot:3272073-Pleurochrysis_carterae.AAC.1
MWYGRLRTDRLCLLRRPGCERASVEGAVSTPRAESAVSTPRAESAVSTPRAESAVSTPQECT